jgi:hypothetical protein
MARVVTKAFTVVTHGDKGSKVVQYPIGKKLTQAQVSKLSTRQIKEYTQEATRIIQSRWTNEMKLYLVELHQQNLSQSEAISRFITKYPQANENTVGLNYGNLSYIDNTYDGEGLYGIAIGLANIAVAAYPDRYSLPIR